MPTQVAHAAHLWLTKHVPEPFMRKLGYVKRNGKLGSSVIANRLALRTTLFLCRACEAKMSRQWQRQYEYVEISSFHADESRCDWCMETTLTTIWWPEEGDYNRQHAVIRGIEQRAAAQQTTLRDGRRIKGT